MSKQSLVYILMILTAAAWGFQPNCVKWLDAEWSPVTITVIRYFLIGVLLLSYVKLYEKRSLVPPRSCWLPLFFMGFTGVMVNNVGQFTGLQYTTVTNATLISAMTPAMAASLAYIFLGELLTRKALLGIILSFAGVILIVTHGSWEIIRHISFNFGDLLCLAAQFSWAVYTLLAAGVLKKMSPEWATGCASICGTAVAALYGFIKGEISVVPLSVPAAASFVYIVLIGGIFSMVSWNLAVKKVGAGLPPIFLNIMPIVGMVSGHFLFGDEIGAVQLLGAAAICTGVYFTTH